MRHGAAYLQHSLDRAPGYLFGHPLLGAAPGKMQLQPGNVQLHQVNTPGSAAAQLGPEQSTHGGASVRKHGHRCRVDSITSWRLLYASFALKSTCLTDFELGQFCKHVCLCSVSLYKVPCRCLLHPFYIARLVAGACEGFSLLVFHTVLQSTTIRGLPCGMPCWGRSRGRISGAVGLLHSNQARHTQETGPCTNCREAVCLRGLA